ncbi:MAG: hypothetical protein HOH58_13005, partial [Opitutaceae bacterium]|nr:hypothetical protein [Opitutaceae bacterium]
LLTADTLQARNYNGVSVIRTAVVRGYVAQLPESSRPKPQGRVSRTLEKLGLTRPPF